MLINLYPKHGTNYSQDRKSHKKWKNNYKGNAHDKI